MVNEADGGWRHDQVPRQEFYEELGSVLVEFSDLLLEDAKGAQKLDRDPYNDWFYCGYGGNEEAFRVSLWPAFLPVVEAYEEGEIPLKDFRAQCWPLSGTEPVTIFLGPPDDVIALAEDEAAVKELADQFAALAGIELVDDWEDVPPEPSAADDGREK